MTTATKQLGHVTQIVGVVVDAEFKDGELPAIYDALTVQNGKQNST